MAKTDKSENKILIPKIYREFTDNWDSQDLRKTYIDSYLSDSRSFIVNLLPENAVALSTPETVSILKKKLGKTLDIALYQANTDPNNIPETIPEEIKSPVAGQPDGSWLKHTNMVGINIRTIGSLWNVIKYILTIPDIQNSIHFLPIWEPGVVGSLYGISSWNINPEMFSEELNAEFPHLDTTGKQLKAVINLLHAMGKAVGMDVIPHTDRFSQIAISHPQYFEWLQRHDDIIIDHSDDLHLKVQKRIWEFLQVTGPADPLCKIPASEKELFSENMDEEQLIRILFGKIDDYSGRNERRKLLVHHIYSYGLEPVPATMAPPYRGLCVKTTEEAKSVDKDGLIWRDFAIKEPQPMSRVFGPLGRYKFYERKDDNNNWEIDFDKPRKIVWDYVCEKYYQVQSRYGFDFMRGDMSHVQMRPEGVPDVIDEYYDVLKGVKNYIQKKKKVSHFGYFAETFLAPRDTMAFGEETDHLEASDADTTLGDLQSTVVGSPEFITRLRQYFDLLKSRSFAPNFTIMTGDKDDPRFDKFYVHGNEIRLFMAFFLADMPSYTGLGFEVRDAHYEPAENEYYTKLYVFHESTGSKSTKGPFKWGHNGLLFSNITRLRIYCDSIWKSIDGKKTRWLIYPDATSDNKILAWTQTANPAYLFVANIDTENEIDNIGIPSFKGQTGKEKLTLDFSTSPKKVFIDQTLTFNGYHYKISKMYPGEGRVYKIKKK